METGAMENKFSLLLSAKENSNSNRDDKRNFSTWSCKLQRLRFSAES